MNKTIIININGIVFHIEEDAYEMLRTYMIDIKKHFGQTPDSLEILADIENRIAEMFSEHIQQGKKEVITEQDVHSVITQMGCVSDFEDAEIDSSSTPWDVQDVEKEEMKYTYTEKKLLRDPDDKILGGVCTGLGHYFDIQPKWIRIFFLLIFLLAGSGVLLYVVLWIVMPIASSRADRMAMKGEKPNLQNFKKSFEEELDGFKDNILKQKSHFAKGANVVGEGFSSLFLFIGKTIGFILLVFVAFAVLGMMILLGFGLLGIFTNYVDRLPPLEYMGIRDAVFALLAGVSAITIPLIGLFYLLLRVLFRIKSMNNYLSLVLWATWLLSVCLIIYFAFETNSLVSERSVVKIEQKLERKNNYFFTERDLRVFEVDKLDNGQQKLALKINGKKIKNDLYDRIDVDFEPLDSLAAPYLQLKYSAKGKSREEAADHAAQVDYVVQQMEDKVYLDSHFTLNSFGLKRDHRVGVAVYLPLGSKVTIDESLESKLSNISLWKCARKDDTDHIKQTDWVMTKSGLVCAVKKEQSDAEEDQ